MTQRLSLPAAMALVLCVAGPALGQSAIKDLYIEAAAASVICAGVMFDDAEKARLAAVITAETKEPADVGDVSQRLEKAKTAFPGPGDCKDIHSTIHVQFFNDVLLPRLRGMDKKD